MISRGKGMLALASILGAVACGSAVTDAQQSGGAGGGGEDGGIGGAGGMTPDGGGGGGAACDGAPECAPKYTASNLFTHVPRFVVFKADPAHDRCVRLWVEQIGGGPGLGIMATAPWSVNKAEITEHASDCVLDNGYPKQALGAAAAVTGTGTLKVEGGFPCAVTVHATVTFDAQAAPWAPKEESLDVEMLPVDGGCG